MRIVLLTTILLTLSAWRSESFEGTRVIPKTVEPCYSTHGRLFVANGTPSVRIWIVGTKRILGVAENWDPENPETPILPAHVKKDLNFDVRIYGDYLVCPLTKFRSGWMQLVYVKEATNLVYENLSDGSIRKIEK